MWNDPCHYGEGVPEEPAAEEPDAAARRELRVAVARVAVARVVVAGRAPGRPPPRGRGG